jgi:hypothetical protein
VTDIARKTLLVEQLRRYAAQAELLLTATFDEGNYDGNELAHWRALYSDHAHQIIDDRDQYLADPELTTVRDLELWCVYARHSLSHSPQQQSS